MEINIKLVLFIIAVVPLDKVISNEQDNTAPNDPYASYILWPHFSFIGIFRADVSTVNNIVSNYNPNKTTKDPYWHPKGSGEWSVNARVTHMCFANGSCSAPDDGEIPVTDTGTKTFAKLVDLDTQAQFVSEIWGWKIRVGNYFSGCFNPVPFKYMWSKMPDKAGMPGLGAVYQSELLKVKWNKDFIDQISSDFIKSPQISSDFFKQLKEAMGNDNIESDQLSMRFNMDMYVNDPEQSNFTTGRISGTIGLLGKKSPPFFILGRSMKSKVDYLNITFFYVDQRNKKVFIDFGNSLPINDDGSMSISHYGNLYVALSKGEHPKLDCSDELLWIGSVHYKLPQWYLNTSGIQTFPVFGSFSTQEMTKLQNSPLLVVETTGNPPNLVCKKVLLAEASDGIDIHPYNLWVQRKNPGDIVSIEVFATKFGNPFLGAEVKLEPCNSVLDEDGTPLVGQPPLDVNPNISVTNDDGIANFTFVANDPQNSRTYIDGQLYPFLYSINGTKTCNNDTDLNSLALIRIFDSYHPNLMGLEPTWLDHVYPIFKKYADLYPVMTDNFVDLANYYDVLRHKKAIKETISLPESDPNYMPVTRDLSRDKKNLILKWLSKEKPDIGDPARFYTLANLHKDLQTALQLEHSTIPPYLTALASIKNSYNLEIQEVIHNIVIQEMMHMALVANILNAVGGEPSVYNEDFIPNYPSRLPGGVQPSLVVPIEKLSLGLVRNIFMKIEQPEVDVSRLSNFEHIFSLLKRIDGAPASNGQCENTEEGIDCEPTAKMMMAQTGPYDPMVDYNVSDCFSSNKEQFLEDFKVTQLINMLQSREPVGDLSGLPVTNQGKPAQGGIFPGENVKAIKSENTIGRFYNHILNALGYLTDCGNDSSIFTGDPSKQVNFDGWSVQGKTIKVTDYQSSIAAIQAIVEQGEGSSPCNPDSWFSGKEQLSHYYLFYSIAEKREIKVFHTNRTGSNEDSNCSYQFCGPMIPFDPNGVWPMVDSPGMSRYQPGSKAYRQAERFNKAYTRLLKSLDKVFNGHPDTLRDAIGCMYSVDLHLKELVKTPIEDNGDPLVGPNAGPTFDFTP